MNPAPRKVNHFRCVAAILSGQIGSALNSWLARVNVPHHPTESHDPTICPLTAKHFDPRTTQPRRCCPLSRWWSQGRGGRVQHWLFGRNKPNMRNLLRLSTALDVEPTEFIKQDDPGSIIR